MDKSDHPKFTIIWPNVAVMSCVYIGGIYGFFLPVYKSTWLTFFAIAMLKGFGTSVAAHRYFSHQAFKANKPLKLLLVFLQTMTNTHSILKWAKNHRLHHKYTGTNADPYSASRGFFFSHLGWLLVKEHPDVVEKGKKIDMSDLENDPVIQFQAKYFINIQKIRDYKNQNIYRYFVTLSFSSGTILPIAAFCYFGESFYNSFYFTIFLAFVTLNLTFSINSVAHYWGFKPYDKLLLRIL